MTDVRSVTVDPSASLDVINHISNQQERRLGPLVDIGNDGSATMLSFDMDLDKPAQLAVIVLATAPAPAGSTRVGAGGKIVIGGQQTDAAAYRANAAT